MKRAVTGCNYITGISVMAFFFTPASCNFKVKRSSNHMETSDHNQSRLPYVEMASSGHSLGCPCVKWKTHLPFKNESVATPYFTLKGITVKVSLRGTWNERSNAEQWTVDIFSGPSLVRKWIGVAMYMHSGKSYTFVHAGKLLRDSEFYNFTRENLKSCGVSRGEVTIVFILHPSFMDIEDKELIPASNMMKNEKWPESCLMNLSEDLGSLFDKEEYTDAVLECGDRSFSVSRAILSARSSVFAAMFRSEMSENNTGSVNIEDVDSSVLEQLLRYLYSGRLVGLKVSCAIALYRAADKYSVPSLKLMCGSFFADNFSEDNVCEILSLADLFGDCPLFEEAMSFAACRPKFLGSDKWGAFAECNANIAVKVFAHHFKWSQSIFSQ